MFDGDLGVHGHGSRLDGGLGVHRHGSRLDGDSGMHGYKLLCLVPSDSQLRVPASMRTWCSTSFSRTCVSPFLPRAYCRAMEGWRSNVQGAGMTMSI